jgi:hypothetical protein
MGALDGVSADELRLPQLGLGVYAAKRNIFLIAGQE